MPPSMGREQASRIALQVAWALSAVLAFILFSPAAPSYTRAADASERPTIDRVDATRFSLSHGRVDRVRNEGIAAGLPSVGSPVELDYQAAYRNIPGITATPSFDGPATVLQVINGDPMVTLDDDSDGEPDGTNAIVQAAAWLPPSFSLLVAEGVADPDGDPVGVRWQAPRGGTLYATVALPDRGIVPGTALTSAQLIEGYTANSILYEAPDVGFPIQDSNQDGGLLAVSARAVDAPADSRPSFSRWESRLLGYANPMEVNITIAEQWDRDGSCWVTFHADIDQSFGHPASGVPVETYTTFRWEVGDLPIEDVTGSPDLTVALEEGFHKVTLVASNLGPYSTVFPALLPSPFVYPPNGAPFVSASFSSFGSTLSDTDTIDCEPPDDRRRSLRVEKHPDPGVVIAPPGQDVTYAVTITNDGEVPVTIDRIEDVVRGVRRLVYPDCDTPLPVELGVGATLTCTFTTLVDWPLGGQHQDTVVVYGHDEQGNQVIGRGQATVEVDWPPGSLVVTKRASVDEIDIPGGTVDYWIEVGNPSDTTDVTVQSVIDDSFGDVGPYCDVVPPVVLEPRDSFGCHFEANVQGRPDTEWTNTVTVSGADANGSPVTATAKATVRIKDFVADLTVLKGVVGNKTFLPEAERATVEYFFVVVNESEWDSVTLTDVTDVVDGSEVLVDVGAACADPSGVPTLTIPPQGWILCRFEQEFQGQPGGTHVDQLFVEGIDEDGYPPSGRSNQVAVSFKDVPSSIEVTKVADITELPAAGGDVTFTVTVRNTSEVDAVTITSLSDDRLTSVASCSGIVGTVLDPGETIECTLVERIDPRTLPGYGSRTTLQHENTVTVTAEDDDGTTIHADDSEVVTVEGGASCVDVSKSASPSEVDEPGGPVLFTVTATNCSDRAFTVVGVSDDTYPTDLARCYPSLVGTVVEPGDSVLCNFLARVEGQPADPPHVDVATVVVDYGLGEDPLIGQASAEVRIRDLPSSISVSKSGGLVAASDGSSVFRFRVVVENTSQADEVSIADVVDFDVGGQIMNRVCSPALGIPLGPGHRLECTFLVHVFGQPGTTHFDVAVAIGTDDDSQPVSGSAATTVTLPEASMLVVSKTATPSVVDEPGKDDVRFSVEVHNASVVNSVTITSISDSRYGGIAGAGDCGDLVGVTLAAGEVRRCAYSSSVIGQPGEYPNVVTVRGRDEYDRSVSASAEAIVTIRDVPAQIEVTKEADRASAESGEVVNYTVTVTNVTPFVPMVIASVIDDRVGDVGQWCAPRTPALIAPGMFMLCRYPGVVSGDPGDVFVNIATASTEKPWFWGQPASDSAGATVMIEESAPTDEDEEEDGEEEPGSTDEPEEEPDTGTAAWKLFDILTNPRNGDLVYDTSRMRSSCSLGDGDLSVAHARFLNNEPTVDVTLSFAYQAPPGEAAAGELVEIPIELSVMGMYDSENAGATAGFAGYADTLSVSACSLGECPGAPDARPEQSGVASIKFPGPPSDPTATFEIEAFINDTSPAGSNCRVRYVYDYTPPNR